MEKDAQDLPPKKIPKKIPAHVIQRIPRGQKITSALPGQDKKSPSPENFHTQDRKSPFPEHFHLQDRTENYIPGALPYPGEKIPIPSAFPPPGQDRKSPSPENFQDRTENPHSLSISISRPEPADPSLGRLGGTPAGPAGTGLSPDPLEYSQWEMEFSGIFWKLSQGWSQRFPPTQTFPGLCADWDLQNQKNGVEKVRDPPLPVLFGYLQQDLYLHLSIT